MISFPSLDQSIKNLAAWFHKEHRKLSFRENPASYTTWVSEVMSQQTTIQAVIPYFDRFIKRFPTIYELADAQEVEVLTLWSGLGYYSRGENLHKTAKIIVSKYYGDFPQTFKELTALPGIGEYTAGAILSIAMNKPCPIVDTNVKRVFSRLRAQNLSKKRLWKLADIFVNYTTKKKLSSPSIINQAIMEIGSLICKSKQALCIDCPLNSICRSYIRKKNPLDFPKLDPPKKKIEIEETVLLFTYKEKKQEWILIIQHDNTKWTKGLWDLPKEKSIFPHSDIIQTSYTITNHTIRRTIKIIPLIHKEIPSLFIQEKNMEWMNLTKLDLKAPYFPMGSALKHSLSQYKKTRILKKEQ